MYIALYEFKVKTGLEKQFIENWHIVTEAIYKYRGSLGSRLHKASDETYLAYAQWPSESQYNLETPLPDETMRARTLMKEACSNITVLKTMTVIDDLFKD